MGDEVLENGENHCSVQRTTKLCALGFVKFLPAATYLTVLPAPTWPGLFLITYVRHTGSSKKTVTHVPTWLCIGSTGLVCGRKAGNSNMLEFFCTTLYNFVVLCTSSIQ